MIPEGDPNTFIRSLYGCEASEIRETVLLIYKNETMEALKQRADTVKEFSGFFKGFEASFGSKAVSVFSLRVGSPMASDCTYFLRFTPCRNIVYTGLIGALQQQIRIGDLIVPTSAFRGEGASRYFIDESYPAVADFSLLRTLASTLEEVYANSGISIYYGPIYTTDSFASETEEFLTHWRSKNLLGIEMETSAIYTVASLYGLHAAAVHVVSDNPVTEKSFFHTIPEEDKNRRRTCEALLVEALIRLIHGAEKT